MLTKFVFASLLFMLLCSQSGYTQKRQQELVDSLLIELPKAKEDSTKVNLYAAIMFAYVSIDALKGLTFQPAALALATKINWPIGIARIQDKTGRLYWKLGNFSKALEYHSDALELFTEADDKYKNYVMIEIAQDYIDSGDYTKGESYLLKSLTMSTATVDRETVARAYNILIYVYGRLGKTEEFTKAMYEYTKVSDAILLRPFA